MPQNTLKSLAETVNGTWTGNADLVITRVVHPSQAENEGDLALILDAGLVALATSRNIQTALVPEDLDAVDSIPNIIRVARPKVALAALLNVFETPPAIPAGIHPSAFVDSTAILADGVVVGPLCTVGPRANLGAGTRLVSHVSIGADVVIGENTLCYPGVVLGDRVRLGNRVILQSNASIGPDGFSYVTRAEGSVEAVKRSGEVTAKNEEILRINSIGTVVLEDDVEIGANACIDRATLGETRIGKGTKIDNQVQIGHNVVIGQNCLIAGQVGIAGSAVIGDRVVMGGQVGVRDHVTVGDDVVIVAKSGVTADVPAKTILMGLQGMPRKEFLTREVKLHRLFRLPEEVQNLSRRLAELEEDLVEREASESSSVGMA